MVRLAILLVLLCLTLYEWHSGVRKSIYWVCLAGLFAFFALRYGQGTDYITYMSIYANVPPLNTFPSYGAFQYNEIEIGFFYLVSFFRMLNVHYILFVAIVTGFSFFCIHRFIKRFSELPVFSLTIFFAIYSLVYMESAVRQMLTLAIAMGFVFTNWADGRHTRAIIAILIASLIHTSAVVLLLLPVLFWNPRSLYIIEWKPRTTVIVGVLFIAAAGVVNFVDLSPIIQLLPARIQYNIFAYYNEQSSISLMALGNRALFMAIVFFLAFKARGNMNHWEKMLFNLYCVGFGIYVLFMSFDLIASRTNVYFRIIEVCLIPLLFAKNRAFIRKTYVAVPVMLALMSFLYVKDITTIMDYAQYYDSNPLNYPYITVFNTDMVYDSKFVNVKNAAALNAYQAGGMSWDEYYETLQRKPAVRSPIVPY